MKISITDFILLTLTVAVGTLVALAIAAIYAKQQIAATTANNPLASLIGL